MDIFAFLQDTGRVKTCTSGELLYEHMESQSNYMLPIVYTPVDIKNRGHWADRGNVLDYLYGAGGEGINILDFGPGDGWPSLPVAKYTRTVTGLDSSQKRVSICRQNARKLGISNAHFVHYEAGSSLPFPDGAFDGIMAASSVEQTPDPRKIINEFYRVLKPGGRLRLGYESLESYRGGKEQELWLQKTGAGRSMLLLYNRDPDSEQAEQYVLDINMPIPEIQRKLKEEGSALTCADLTPDMLAAIMPSVGEIRYCVLTHPACSTFVSWLKEAGFSEVKATHSGGRLAGELFDFYQDLNGPVDLPGLDNILKPAVRAIVELEAPLVESFKLSAVK